MFGYVSKEKYMEQINQIVSLLEGKTNEIIKQIDLEIKKEADKQNYEQAAILRDKKLAIERISEKQKVSNISENNIDVIGLARNDLLVCIELFFVRGSKMIGREHYFFENLNEMEEEEILASFIKQYYIPKNQLPNKIMLQEEIVEKDAIEKILTENAGRKVEIKAPQKGEKLRFVEMAIKNAKVTLDNKSKNKYDILKELKEVLNLDKLPRKIECYDISNISGEYTVAAMCVMQDGEIKRNLSRRFKIKEVFGQDDPKCMEEVITRRLKHSINNSESGFGKLPDVIFADGGITQIRAIKKAISKYDLNIKVYGMVKDNKHTTRALITEEREEIKISQELMNLITNFQDTVHETAIEYHRKTRDKEITKSELEKIHGIGESKKTELLKYFGSVEKIKKATIEELQQVKGINEKLANAIKENIK